ncbi:SDR family oxidoreductase [Roseivirga sp. BDSF3-8]|uniref:SDR family oxidoreductase n=1 Tax=Roseivirga sp. BDSF3-8 TaxID=3241598 RepID=UPI0035323BA8
MNKTVIITGCSSGIDKATALYFGERGYNVIATMRTPERENGLEGVKHIDIQKMDVTDRDSIKAVVGYAIEKFGTVDVLVNNAGIGVFGAFEAADEDLIRKQFDTNVFGVMNTIKEILPHFRSRKKGKIINISSGVGKVPLPMQSLYGSTKFALEGFSESLHYELSSLGISVKIVLPGNIKTDFFKSLYVTDITGFPDYKAYQQKVLTNIEKLNEKTGASPEFVASIIYKAATDNKNKLRYLAGKDISLFAKVRKILPDSLFMKVIKNKLEK